MLRWLEAVSTAGSQQEQRQDFVIWSRLPQNERSGAKDAHILEISRSLKKLNVDDSPWAALCDAVEMQT